MRKIAFGYSTRCNLRCGHCVAAGEAPNPAKMELSRALEIIREMAAVGVGGISFTAGEPMLYFEDMLELLDQCRELGIYTRLVTNSFWAITSEVAEQKIARLLESGLCQLRLSYSRWHQQHVPPSNILNAAKASQKRGLAYFISFVTDFSSQDDEYENFLRSNDLKFFPEPLIFSGRADNLDRTPIFTDYQDNRCSMNPYLAPDLNMYGCCDAGSHFTNTNFFLLGNLAEQTIEQIFSKNETHPLYNCIRHMGITPIASFAGYKAREIVTYRKCELCKLLFDSPDSLKQLTKACNTELRVWTR
ncbi:MAG: radical SAM protein [Desulfobulbaceae bacterium]|nr:radical SAM protein [Desulfobulbaceae bacterium]